MKTTKRIAFALTMIMLSVGFFSGCDAIDKLAQKTPDMTKSGQALLDSPAGEYIPKPVKDAVHIAGYVALSLASTWLYVRKEMFKEAMSEVALSNEILVNDNPDLKTKVQAAEEKALNPPVLKLLRKEGFNTEIS